MGWILKLSLEGPFGEQTKNVCFPVDEFIISKIQAISPPDQFNPEENFSSAVEKIRVREFRKDLLVDASTRLGHKLAAYMEDSEGWHGARRQELIKIKEGK